MKQRTLFILILTGMMIGSSLTAACRGLGIAEGRESEGSASSSNQVKAQTDAPIACVRTAPLRRGTITERIVVYGQVIPAPGALQTVSVPFESQAISIMVNEGQKVFKGDGLLKIRPSPDTLLQFNQARNASESARLGYQQVERRYGLKLATNEQLLQAKQTLDQTKLTLESMKSRGVDSESDIASRVSGLVKKIYVREGSIVPAGGPIIDIVSQNRLEALLGVEPEDIERVRPGREVSLTRVNAPASPEVEGKVRKISYAVNPATRLVDVFVTLTSPARFLLGESIEGGIAVTSAEGLIVPRTAVLPEGNRNVLFTVKDGRAVRHTVDVGIENARESQVAGLDLQEGENVVVLGNYELSDGMAVTTEACR